MFGEQKLEGDSNKGLGCQNIPQLHRRRREKTSSLCSNWRFLVSESTAAEPVIDC